MTGEPSIVIRRGECRALLVFDIAYSIDLDRAEQALAAQSERQRLRHGRRAPSYFEYRPAPLRVHVPVEPVTIGEFQTADTLELVFFDFGAVCASFRVPLACPASGLLDLSEALFDNPRLLELARTRVDGVAATIAAALRKPGRIGQVEDYTIHMVHEVEIDGQAVAPAAMIESAPTLVAQVLRSERAPLSDEEIADALACRVSYGRDDAVLIDWNAALVLDRDSEDVRAVLEFANVELLEMRFLDDRLDEILEQAHRVLPGRRTGVGALLSPRGRELYRIGRLQVDSALLFEGVNNALKLIGDQYLARLYRLAAKRFHLPDRDQTIERKLQTIESLYGKINDAEATRRMELLEWIVILLILFEVVMGLMRMG